MPRLGDSALPGYNYFRGLLAVCCSAARTEDDSKHHCIVGLNSVRLVRSTTNKKNLKPHTSKETQSL